jgi:NADH-quinone oxidoreductase subunit M
MIDYAILSWLIWLPIAGGAALLVMDAMGNTACRQVALLVSIVTFALSTQLYTHFDLTTAVMQFQENIPWIDAFSANYHLGVDGISMPLIILTTFTTILVVLAGWQVIQKKTAQYMAAFLIMEGLMVGVFAALDAVLFYVFWEAMLVPMFLIIGVWGGPNRVYATIKFFLYTFFGSVFMLVALIYMYLKSSLLPSCWRLP